MHASLRFQPHIPAFIFIMLTKLVAIWESYLGIVSRVGIMMIEGFLRVD